MHAVASEQEILIEKLQNALDNESNAHLRYLEFAEKADGEGWHGVASLFRGVARAEEIHAANHRRILHQFEPDLHFVPARTEEGTTIENVRTALAAELCEVGSIYPTCADMARTAREVSMVRTFTWALAAEKTHARLFNEALALLEIEDEDAWITMVRDFYVCPVCGFTSEFEDEARICPSCFCSRSRFEAIR
ncbi:MAG TPA: rubrerythrin family protein [Terracidiphilus sp.]